MVDIFDYRPRTLSQRHWPLPRRHARRMFIPLLATCAAACLLAIAGGCREEVSPAELEVLTAESKPPEQDHFEIGIDFLKMRDEHNLDGSANQASYHLNRWMRNQAADPRWMINRRMLNTLPDAIRRAEATKAILSDKALAKLEFGMSDVLLMEESRWLHAIAKLVAQTPPDPMLLAWSQEAGLSPKTTKTLATSQALFDWTVRNIQLEALLEYPKASAAGPVSNANGADPTAGWPPPMLAQPGPGYTGYPWHVLLYGTGDTYQRARVFMLLLRQLRIDAVMLGIDTKVGRARPWLPAVIIDKELYLFDTTVGLPIPGSQGVGIATLSKTMEDPAILKALNIGENYVYPVVQADLDKVVALIDASPEYLSQRMLLAEKHLSAADQMVLAVTLSDLARQLDQCTGLIDVRLWAVPIETNIYQQAYNMMLERNPQSQAAWNEMMAHGLFRQLNPLVKGRRSYLLGRFNKEGDDEGAAGHFRDARVTDASLAELETSRRLQASMGLERPRGMSDQDWSARLKQLLRLQIQSKQHASYWTGLAHQQQKNYQVATNWLNARTLEKSPDGPWTNGARYNLARCYEQLGKTKEAIQLYRIDESPQRYGNLLRAQQLETQAAAAEKNAGADTNAPPPEEE